MSFEHKSQAARKALDTLDRVARWHRFAGDTAAAKRYAAEYKRLDRRYKLLVAIHEADRALGQGEATR